MRRWIGIGMLTVPFVILGFGWALKIGIGLTLLTFGIVAVAVLWVYVGINLTWPVLLLLVLPAWGDTPTRTTYASPETSFEILEQDMRIEIRIADGITKLFISEIPITRDIGLYTPGSIVLFRGQAQNLRLALGRALARLDSLDSQRIARFVPQVDTSISIRRGAAMTNRVRWDAVVSRILTESPRDHRDGCYNVAWNRETVCWFWYISDMEYQKMETRMREIS